MNYAEAFLLGVFGSFHCLGMCGPIVMALPFGGETMATKFRTALLYNAGRVLTYMLMGILLGMLGQNLALWGVQRWVSILLGVAMVSFVAWPVFWKKSSDAFYSNIWNGLLGSTMGKLLARKGPWSELSIGILNGLLPCGLVYLALAGALVRPQAFEGGLYMLFFGLGTFPLMATLVLAKNLVSLKWRNQIRRAVPVLIVFLGLLFILRGLNLGIPYLSPKMEKPGVAKCCHS